MITGLKKTLRALLPKDVASAVVVAGSIDGNETSAPVVAASHNPRGVTCTRTSEGLYVLTLPGAGAITLVSCVIQLRSPDRDLIAVTVRNESARTVTIRVYDTDESSGSHVVEDLETDEGFDYIAVLKG